jgi:hypothetical protein
MSTTSNSGVWVDHRGDLRDVGSISWCRKNTDYRIPAGTTLSQSRVMARKEADRLLHDALVSGYTPLHRALDTGDVDLLRVNVGNIVGHLLSGRPYHVIEHVKFHVFDYIIRLLRRTSGTPRYNPAYTMSVIKAECMRFIFKVDRPDQYPLARPPRYVPLCANTPAQQPSSVVLDDWLPLANSEQERIALVTLEAMHINTKVRMRHCESMKLRDQILAYCAIKSGLCVSDVQAMFIRVALATLTSERISSVIKFVANLPR